MTGYKLHIYGGQLPEIHASNLSPHLDPLLDLVHRLLTCMRLMHCNYEVDELVLLLEAPLASQNAGVRCAASPGTSGPEHVRRNGRQ